MQNFPYELTEQQLRHADSFKWTKYPADVLPLWVADMDFAIAPGIREALTKRLHDPIGYNQVEGDPILIDLIRQKLLRAGWDENAVGGENKTGKHWIRFVTGVVPALATCILGLTKPGQGVMTMTPIYPPFLAAVKDHNRILHEVPLTQTDNRWQIDFTTLEAAANSPEKPTLLLLCHPHNPTGRVWTPQELRELADFADHHNLHVVSDELHADLTLDPVATPHTPFVFHASDALKKRTITLTGPCKTYNTAGLGIGALIAHDPLLLARVMKSTLWVAGHPSALSVAMWKAALNDDGQWLASILNHLRFNRDFLELFVKEHLRGVKLARVEATYLAFLDYRSHPQAKNIGKFLLEAGKIALNDGPMFGTGYEGFVRLNFATSLSILKQAVMRLASVHAP